MKRCCQLFIWTPTVEARCRKLVAVREHYNNVTWGCHGGDYEDGCLLGFYTLMMEAVQTSETLVNSYQSTTRCYNPQDSHLHHYNRSLGDSLSKHSKWQLAWQTHDYWPMLFRDGLRYALNGGIMKPRLRYCYEHSRSIKLAASWTPSSEMWAVSQTWQLSTWHLSESY
jgi:hypothetical protein